MSILRKLRVDAHLTIEQLADISGVSARQIRNLEDGTTQNPRVDTLTSLAGALTSDPSRPVLPSDIDPYKKVVA